MNRKKAYTVLGLNEDREYSDAEIKKEYHSKMLQYHPDKNKSPDANTRCIEIQDAYNYLRTSEYSKPESYGEMLKSFLQSVFREEETSIPPLIYKILDILSKKIIEYNTDRIIDYLRKINTDTLRMIYPVLSKYRTVLHFSEELFSRIDELLNTSECIVLNPTLDDLLSEENVYILKHDSETFLVPLWHHEMVFDCSGCEHINAASTFTVKIIPLLPDNMELDEYNVLTVWLEYKVSDIWNREVVVEIGGIPFVIYGRELKMTDQLQRIEYPRCGIPYNNTENVFDCSVKQPVVFIVRVLPPTFSDENE